MKATTIVLLAVLFEILNPLNPLAWAQSLSSGTLTPVSSTISTHLSHKHEDQHRKSARHHAEQKSKHRFLPADERYASLSQAEAHCPPNTVEWASLGNSSLYHNSQSRWFGRTKHGAYACKAILDQAGFRAGK